MAVELVKDILKVNEIKGKEQIQTLVENELYLKQSNPDIDKILWIDGKTETMSIKIIKDKVIVNGIVDFKIAYKSKTEDFDIQVLESTSDFKEEINIEGINDEMIGAAKVDIEYIEYELVDERKIFLKALLNIEGKVEATNSIQIVKDIKNGDGLEILKEKVKYNNVLGVGDSFATVRETFELKEGVPDIEKVLKVDLNTYELEHKVVKDKVIVSGIVEYGIIYYGKEKLNSLNRQISFNHFVEIPGVIQGSNCKIKLNINDAEYEVKENLEGDMRVLDFEATVKIDAKVYQQEEKEIILDAYSTKRNTQEEKNNLVIYENIKNLSNEEMVKSCLDDNSFGKVYSITGKSTILESRIMEGKVILEGLLLLNIIFSPHKSQEIVNVKKEIPFKSYIDIEDMQGDVEIEIESFVQKIEYNIDETKLELQIKVKNFVSLNKQRNIDIILNLIETEQLIDKTKRPSIIVYVVQKEDSIWEIAKRYNTTVDEIVGSNKILSPDSLMPGEKIIIEKNIDSNF